MAVNNQSGRKNKFYGEFGATTDHLMWFVQVSTLSLFPQALPNTFYVCQVSDIHFSIYRDPDRVTEFTDLLRNTITPIRPAVVIASGDLTDAREGLGSVQHEKEWQMYYETVKTSGILEHTTWLDIRGNHDTFNVDSYNGQADYFKNYSIQGKLHRRSYAHQMEVNGNKYTFLGLDASLVPGPKRPFNFVGEVQQDEINKIQLLINNSRQNSNDYLIWFGHYPTSCIMSPGADTNVRKLIGDQPESLVYLCGHLHTFAGLVPRMISLQSTGYLEMELGDWMRNRRYRLAAVDHGLFSFTDQRHNDFPVVLITNPKNSALHIPGKEDPTISLESTHIRLLAFSNAQITECHIRINSEPGRRKCVKSESDDGLFVATWSPKLYKTGLHYLEVEVKDAEGRSRIVGHHFTMENNSEKKTNGFSFMANFMLMTDFTFIWIIVFGVSYGLCVVPLLIYRVLHKVTVYRGGHSPMIRWKWLRVYVRKHWLLCSIDRLFYPLILFYLYILLGPWMVGEVIDGHTGWVFMWGIFVKGVFLPGTLSYLYGFVQLMLCQLPLIYIFACMVDWKYKQAFRGSPLAKKKKSTFQTFWPHLPFTLIILVEIILAIFFLLAYGPTSFVLGPLRTWSVVLHIFLFHQAYRLEEKSLRSGMLVWKNDRKPS